MKHLLSIALLCLSCVMHNLLAATTIPIVSRQELWTPNTYTGYTGGIPTNRTVFCNVKVNIPGTNSTTIDWILDMNMIISK